tara:strand:- start:732 stop:1328 length:597 start_codon:yes stop_codon:yes gene_type:complete
MIKLPIALLRLIDSLKNLPGVGSKTAERLSYFILESHPSYIDSFSQNLLDINKEIEVCNICFFLMEKNKDCICANSLDKTTICVVQKPKDVIAFDRTGYKGMYHVLGGVLSPLDQIGPEDLNIKEFMSRINNDTNEVILAMDTSLEGDATSVYIADLLERYNPKIKISRLARGIPIGGQFDYIDDMTLIRAFDERTEL